MIGRSQADRSWPIPRQAGAQAGRRSSANRQRTLRDGVRELARRRNVAARCHQASPFLRSASVSGAPRRFPGTRDKGGKTAPCPRRAMAAEPERKGRHLRNLPRDCRHLGQASNRPIPVRVSSYCAAATTEPSSRPRRRFKLKTAHAYWCARPPGARASISSSHESCSISTCPGTRWTSNSVSGAFTVMASFTRPRSTTSSSRTPSKADLPPA